MPTYKLTYFNARGYAELIRYVFAASGTDFEDVRLEPEQWPSIKPTTPEGTIPVLEVDGKVMLSQSRAIARYVARQTGLAGKTDIEMAQADMFAEIFSELQRGLGFLFEKDETKKATLKECFLSETAPKILGNLERLLISNEGGNGFLVGSGLTWADLIAYNISEYLPAADPNIYNTYPKLKEHVSRVKSESKIAEYLKRRPATEN